MNKQTPTTEEVLQLAHWSVTQAPEPERFGDIRASLDQWLREVQAQAWDEGSRAGLDAGLAAAETTQQGNLANLPPFPPNPYR